MRFLTFFLLTLACVAFQKQQKAPAPGDAEYIDEDPRLAQLVGTPGPAITLQALDGTLVNLADSYGKKPIYLKLWASYCIPCRAQMPKFEKIYESVGDRMQVIAVNAGVGDDPAKVASFVAKTGMHMPIAIDDGSLGAWLKMDSTPLHLLIGRDGRIVFAGHQDGPALDAAIQRSLDSPASRTPVKSVAVNRLTALKLGDSVPAMTLTGANGSKVELKGGDTGHPRALLFTSTWCESYLKDIEPQSVENCRRARSEAAQFAQSGSVQWLGVVTNLWTTPESLAEYRTKTKQQLSYVVDTEGTAFRVFGIRRFPAVALIDARGRLRRVVGPDDKDLAAALKSLATP